MSTNTDEKASEAPMILVQFQSAEGVETGPMLSIPTDSTLDQLRLVINNLLENDENLPYSFYVDGEELLDSIKTTIQASSERSTEDKINIVYQPQALFRVKTVTRCTSTLSGHTEAVLSVSFSPDGSQLASGSGDTTVRLWDLSTETPQFTCKGHTNWVLYTSWSPNGKILASGGMDNTVRLWDPQTGLQIGGHTAAVTCVCWGGDGNLYTSSQDKTIKVWNSQGKLIKTLSGHAHWVNSLAISSGFVLRTGANDHTGKKYDSPEEAKARALERYNELVGSRSERLVSGSDDFTMYLWDPKNSKKPIARLVGHQKLVNHVGFSPDGRYIASASFDNSVKIWDGVTGKFIASLRGHVGPVYQVSWSSDSRMLISSSRDSTIKLWDVKTKKIKMDLPGHLDEVFAVDWSPSGDKVASGGKDRVLKIWRN
ncbi:hypothetical protein BB560_000424 [Smittium megazygosporum]|uniref:NLE domain-containing protein n=1 Tax=Smittium megazygosporum TaxID=133381 RepID=A0A2T9ZKC9_9FUNG|nr:hypothetical protein BB560_000424 [Smittium megazygosporum]